MPQPQRGALGQFGRQALEFFMLDQQLDCVHLLSRGGRGAVVIGRFRVGETVGVVAQRARNLLVHQLQRMLGLPDKRQKILDFAAVPIIQQRHAAADRPARRQSGVVQQAGGGLQLRARTQRQIVALVGVGHAPAADEHAAQIAARVPRAGEVRRRLPRQPRRVAAAAAGLFFLAGSQTLAERSRIGLIIHCLLFSLRIRAKHPFFPRPRVGCAR